MKIVHLVPGTGSFFCGSCLRDHALARQMRRLGHEVLLAPLYLPLVLERDLDEPAPPIFFGGINVYLQQKFGWFQSTPRWLDRWLDAPGMLRLLGRRAASTRAADLGRLTISMLRGEEGAQRKELNRLVTWLAANDKPDVVCLSNGLLAGLARRIKQRIGVPVICTLHGEDAFLDNLAPPYCDEAWELLTDRAADVDRFVAVSHYYGRSMQQRLHLDPARLRIVHNGIELDDLEPASSAPAQPILGYLARMCADKGLKTLADAFILLRQRARVGPVRLHVAGAMTGADRPFLQELRKSLRNAGLLDAVSFEPNCDRSRKVAFLRQLSVFSVPATYGEAFGLYVLEALACGVPVVQPRHAAFPEILALTGGGTLCAPDDTMALAVAIEAVLLDQPRARQQALAARAKVLELFSAARMAHQIAGIYRDATAATRSDDRTATTPRWQAAPV